MQFDFLTTSTPFFAENGFWFAIKESSWPGVVVCLVLAVLSCFSWAVMVSKLRVVSRAGRRDRRFLEAYRNERDPLSAYEHDQMVSGSPLSGIYQAGARELSYHLLGSNEVDGNFRDRVDSAGRLRPSQLDAVSNAMDRAAGGATSRLESQMSVLATAVSGAPFLGLLGTVWGVMDTFSSVASSAGAASLKTMAPGVSAALVTTVVGLLVAIPAMFGYNFLVNRIRAMLMSFDNYSTELRLDFERWYVDHAVENRVPVAALNVTESVSVPVKKARLKVKELVEVPVTASVPASVAVVGSEVEMGRPVPSHKIVKREEPLMVAGELDLGVEDES